MTRRHAVLLVPGFMGFGRFGDFFYFVDRAASALRGALQSHLECDVPVTPVSTDPSGSLRARQQFLLESMRRVDAALGGVDTFHLVGHSIGGVDATLLLSRSTLDGDASWQRLDPTGLRGRIGSVTTLAASSYGTTLALSHAVGFLLHPFMRDAGPREALSLAKDTLRLFAERRLTLDVLAGALSSSSVALRFLWQFLTHDVVLAEMAPHSMMQVQNNHPPELDVPIIQFVTVTPETPVVTDGVSRGTDGLFETLRALTQKYAASSQHMLAPQLEMLNAGRARVIGNPNARLSGFGPGTCDGVVNSSHQLLCRPGARLAAVVVADHADVIGHYDQPDPLGHGLVCEGFFRSGSGFADAQFFELYDCIAQEIASTVHHRQGKRRLQHS